MSKGGGRGGVDPALAGPALNATGPVEGGEYVKKCGSTDDPGDGCCRLAGSGYPGGIIHGDDEGPGRYSGALDEYAGALRPRGEEVV